MREEDRVEAAGFVMRTSRWVKRREGAWVHKLVSCPDGTKQTHIFSRCEVCQRGQPPFRRSQKGDGLMQVVGVRRPVLTSGVTSGKLHVYFELLISKMKDESK